MKINPEELKSMIGLLEHDGTKETSCSFRKYSLVIRKNKNGVSIKWYKRLTREPIEADI